MKLLHNRYVIDGVDVIELVEKYGSPVYVYQTSRMKHQYEKMLHAFKDIPVKINFACKALNNLNILRFFKNLGSGLDAVSIQEVQLGIKAGFKPQDIIFTPNN
jgi:diaminopimelate decarboxylase